MKNTVKILAIILSVLFILCGCGTNVDDQAVTTMAEVEQNQEIRINFMGCGDNITYEGNLAQARENATDGGAC